MLRVALENNKKQKLPLAEEKKLYETFKDKSPREIFVDPNSRSQLDEEDKNAESALERLQNFVADKPERTLLVTGAPNLGESALLKRVTHQYWINGIKQMHRIESMIRIKKAKLHGFHLMKLTRPN